MPLCNTSEHVSSVGKRIVLAACVGIAVASFQGCGTKCVVALKDGNAANEIHSPEVVWGNHYITAEPDTGQMTSRGIQQVVVEDNFFYDVVGVLSLGLLKPHKVTYRNIKPPIDSGGDMTSAPADDRRADGAHVPQSPQPLDQGHN